MQPDNSYDIVIAGAGLAGASAAHILGRQGWRVLLVDPRSSYPPVFKLEKIEPDQAETLRTLGLLEPLLARASRIRNIHSYHRGKFLGTTPTAQYGIPYDLLVNSIRATLPDTVDFQRARVVNIAAGTDVQRVELSTGEQLCCRLVILACGLHSELLAGLGFHRKWIQKQQSMAAAFSLSRMNGAPFASDSITYAVASPSTGIDYVSFFPIGEHLRANLFAFPAADTSWVQRLVRDPNRELPRLLPKLHSILGDYCVTGKVATALIHLYRTESELSPGVVTLGDACQNVCPSTGMGLTKICTDLSVLCSDCIPQWFATPGITREKIALYFNDPRKQHTDAKALQDAAYRRNACTAESPKWRVHRARLHLTRELGRLQRVYRTAAN